MMMTVIFKDNSIKFIDGEKFSNDVFNVPLNDDLSVELNDKERLQLIQFLIENLTIY
jgi:hypothetical protein